MAGRPPPSSTYRPPPAPTKPATLAAVAGSTTKEPEEPLSNTTTSMPARLAVAKFPVDLTVPPRAHTAWVRFARMGPTTRTLGGMARSDSIWSRLKTVGQLSAASHKPSASVSAVSRCTQAFTPGSQASTVHGSVSAHSGGAVAGPHCPETQISAPLQKTPSSHSAFTRQPRPSHTSPHCGSVAYGGEEQSPSLSSWPGLGPYRQLSQASPTPSPATRKRSALVRRARPRGWFVASMLL